MDKANRRGAVLWVLVAIISLLSAGTLLYFMFQEQTKRIETQEKLSQSEITKKAAEEELDRTQLKLHHLEEQTILLAEQFEQEKSNYQSALLEIEQKDIQLLELGNSLTVEKQEKENLTETLTQLREIHDSLQEELEQARVQIEELQGRLNESSDELDESPDNLDESYLPQGVKLKKIVVRPKEQKEELSGKVLVVNNEFQFVVIDLGKNQGVNVGDDFIVYQDSQEVGKVQVETVYDGMSTASILADSQQTPIKEDSTVKSF